MKDYYLQMLGFYKQEEMFFIQNFYRMLILANGSAIFLLCAYLGTLVGAGKPADGFVFPIFLFLVGLLAAAFIIQYTLKVVAVSRLKITEQIVKIFKDDLDIDDFQPWGFSQSGLVVIGVAQIISGVCFLLGVIVTFFNI